MSDVDDVTLAWVPLAYCKKCEKGIKNLSQLGEFDERGYCTQCRTLETQEACLKELALEMEKQSQREQAAVEAEATARFKLRVLERKCKAFEVGVESMLATLQEAWMVLRPIFDVMYEDGRERRLSNLVTSMAEQIDKWEGESEEEEKEA